MSGAAALAEKALKDGPAKDAKSPQPPPAGDVDVPKAEQETQTQSKDNASSGVPSSQRIFASPIAKKLATERGISLGQLKGTGSEGRIIRVDIENYKAPTPVKSAPASAPSPVTPPPSAQLPDYIDTPISNMRRVIGARLTQSKQELPHYYLTVDITMDKVLKLREVFNKSFAEKDKSAKLSVNDFIVKAVACALSDVPEANSAWLGEVIRT